MYLPSDPRIWQELGRDPLLRELRFWMPILGVVVIIYGSPEAISRAIPFLAPILDFMSNVIPSIHKWVARSAEPATTKLLFSYWWLVLPYYTLIAAKTIDNEQSFVAAWRAKGKIRHVLPLSLMAIAIITISLLYWTALPKNFDCRRLCFHESMVLQAVYGFLQTQGISGLLACIFWWLRNFKAIHFSARRAQ